MLSDTGLWLLFGTIVAVVMTIDLGILQRRPHAISLKESALWTSVWVALALAFAGVVAASSGRTRALEFLAGYLLEESLSADNMFVFLIIFRYFAVPAHLQPRILHWGILGAIVMRFIFIFAGVSLLNRFHWMIYIFGALLIYTGLKMAFSREDSVDPGHNPALSLLRRLMPLTRENHGQHFFVRINGVLHATPLFATLLVVEFSDLIFAVDSIPAVLAITRDTLVVYTSNIFAIMGLRALYFLLANLMDLFRFLKLGVSVILVFVGVKMLGGAWFHVPIAASLGVIAGVLFASVAASLLAGPEKRG